jgi:hypothetical protein
MLAEDSDDGAGLRIEAVAWMWESPTRMSEREIFWRSVYTRIGNLGPERAETILNTFLWRLQALCKEGAGFRAEEVELALENCVWKVEQDQALEN